MAVPENHLKEAFKILKDSDVGIVLLDDCGELKFLKIAKVSKDNLDKMEIFKILRKKEFNEILKKEFGRLPECSDFKYYRECFKMFEQIPIEKILEYFKECLVRRYN